ncbi:MAG: septal ring lytic transglycosylase RlpA family protein [Devosia sp.]
MRFVVLVAILGPVLAACGGSGGYGATVKRGAFTSKEYGVAVSPRVTTNPNPPKGGGRYLVGKPYKVRGKTYVPKEQPDYFAQGTASWYGADFHGRRTANGEIFSANAITGAHPTLPLPSYVRVTNLDNGRSVVVRVNDRGPYVHGRVVDLSHRAAEILGYVNRGMGNVQVQYVGPAPLNGDDTRMLLASINRPTAMEQGATRFAMVEPREALDPFAEGEVRVSNGRINLADHAAQQTGSKGSYSSDNLAEDFFGLFGYAENDAVSGAHAAAAAMASRATALDEWVEAVDEDGRAIDLQLGVFTDPRRADEVAQAFAVLAAVNEEAVEAGGRTATRLILSRLKPGVARSDVLDLARELGLRDIVLY